MTDRKSDEKAPAVSDERELAEDKREVQATVDAENAQGFRGYNPDSTPNENYTFNGQAAGKPTPETDPRLAAEAGRPFLFHAGQSLRDDAKKK
ncbi:MAG: hypothetical protein LC793_05780 [Thermomicrobia bacterium]|nr:hypothetical protein [Thermomicrobia bacterium]MCA1722767.1 hypothetical protein [Thermomicrobia bacterium]